MSIRHFRFVSRSLPMRRPSRVAEFACEHSLATGLALLGVAFGVLWSAASSPRAVTWPAATEPTAQASGVPASAAGEAGQPIVAGVVAPLFVALEASPLAVGVMRADVSAPAGEAVETPPERAEAEAVAPAVEAAAKEESPSAADRAEERRAARPASLAGTWGPSPAACSARAAARTRWLPMTITDREARAGETVCSFRRLSATGNTWTARADCAGPRGRWTSSVRLRVEGGTLSWTSERGVQRYVRCDRLQVAVR
jgi:hypothetical protein